MTSGAVRLVLEDEPAYADLRTFVARARALDADGAVRLQGAGPVLAAYVEVLPGRGLMSEGAVLGLRTMRLSAESTVDVTVPLAAVADRLARTSVPDGLDVPPVTAAVTWAAVTPPRGGWEPVGSVPGATLVQVARDGVEEVAVGAGPGSGAAAVADLRARVWGRLTSTVPPVPAGAAFGAYALGFLTPGGTCDVVANGRWTRLSTPHGHVLVR